MQKIIFTNWNNTSTVLVKIPGWKEVLKKILKRHIKKTYPFDMWLNFEKYITT